MAILLSVISALAAALFIILAVKHRHNHSEDEMFNIYSISIALSICFLMVFVSLVVWTVFLAVDVSNEIVLDRKIEMYTEENNSIENSIDILVKDYMSYENSTFADLKTGESAITLVTLFPELTSKDLVQKQLEIYISNKQLITRLKEQKIDISKKRWLLYFRH